MLIPNKFNGYHNGTRQLHISSGGGGGGGQTTSTVQNTNVPEYARPYVETMLGATQEQLFQGTRGPDVTDPNTGAVTRGEFNITGFKPYQAYGGTYDAQGNQTSYDPSKAVAGFSPMQQAAQQGIANMQMPGQFGAGSDLAVQAGLGGMRSAQDAMRFGQQGQQSGLMGQQLGMQGGAQYGGMGAGYGQQGAQLGIQGGQRYGEMGAGYGQQAAGLADKALGYGQNAADIGMMGLRAEQYGRQVSGQAEDYARQQANAGQRYEQMAQDPRAMQAYMSPYMQNVVDVTNREAARTSAILGTEQQASAAKAGAFGGGRDAVMRAERERNLATTMNQNQALGQQKAFEEAQKAQQFGTTAGLTGLSGAQTGLGTALAGGQLGLSGIGTALQGQQGAMSGVGAANQAYQTGIQGAGMGLQGVNTQLAGTAQGMQGAQIGLQGVDRQLAGTAQGMQGAGMGLQGVSGAQAGYGLANQAGSNLANIGTQQQAAQLGIYGAQNAAGAQQQSLEQQKINQAMQDYANAQQYPLMQLGTMSNMLRGLPMQASTTNQYQAAPNQLSQAIGAAGAGASIYNAMKAEGGVIKGYAKGGIMSYDMGGEVEEQLESMDEKGLQTQARESSSPSIRKMAQRLLRERQMGKQPQGASAMGVQYQAPSMRGGGIIAFAKGDTVYGGPSSEADEGEAEAKIDMEKRLAMPPTTAGGIMGATVQPTTQVPVAPAGPSPDVVKEAMRQRDLNTVQANRSTADVIKEIQAERDASGIGDNKAREEYRSQQMAERANMKDEQERQRHMRLAEFFASWGSTPGPVLVAGMNALKQSIPGIITDQKEAKKARKEADKIIYDIDESTRLDKQGMHNEATARREKAAKQAEEYNKYLLTFQSQRESDKRALEQTTMSTEAQLEAARIQAGAQKGATSQRAKETEMYNIERSLEISRNRLAKVEQDIISTRDKPPKGTPLAKAMESVNRYNNILEKNKGDASKVDDFIKKDAEQAAAVVKRFEDDAKRRLKDARDQVNMYEQTYLTQGRGAKSGAKPSAASNDPFEIMDILKESPAPAASANAPAKTSANAPAAAPAAPATNSLASKIDKETNELGAGTRKAYSPDVQEYFDKLKAERKAKEAAYLKQQQQQMLASPR